MEETILIPRENVARLFKAIQTITMKNSKKKLIALIQYKYITIQLHKILDSNFTHMFRTNSTYE